MSIKMLMDIEALKTRTKALEEKLVKALEGDGRSALTDVGAQLEALRGHLENLAQAFDERLKELQSALEARVAALEQQFKTAKR